MDMSRFIVAKSDQINADDLLGGPRTITITGVRGTDAADQPVSVNYEGDAGKPYKPCKSMRRVMVHCWGKDATKYAGRSMTLYCDPEVQFGGMKVGGIRISHMSDIDGKRQMALTVKQGKKGLYTVHPLTDAPRQQAATFDAELDQLKAIAQPGNMTELENKWRDIGSDARKALGGYLQGLKAACETATDPEPDPDDVAFDTPQSTESYDGV